MGHNRAGVRARAKLKRRRREEVRLDKKAAAQEAATPQSTASTVLDKVKSAAHAVGDMVKHAVEKVTGKGEK